MKSNIKAFEIFNMGVGLMLAVEASRVQELLNEPVYEIGRIVKKENSVIIKLKKR